MSSLESFINDPAFHDLLSLVKGARNGFVYGVKVRFPHALVMAIIFGRGESAQWIFRMAHLQEADLFVIAGNLGPK
jgi:peroxisomal membrane protein 4